MFNYPNSSNRILTGTSSNTEYLGNLCSSRSRNKTCRCQCYFINDHTYTIYNRSECREECTIFDCGNSISVRIHRSVSRGPYQNYRRHQSDLAADLCEVGNKCSPPTDHEKSRNARKLYNGSSRGHEISRESEQFNEVDYNRRKSCSDKEIVCGRGQHGLMRRGSEDNENNNKIELRKQSSRKVAKEKKTNDIDIEKYNLSKRHKNKITNINSEEDIAIYQKRGSQFSHITIRGKKRTSKVSNKRDEMKTRAANVNNRHNDADNFSKMGTNIVRGKKKHNVDAAHGNNLTDTNDRTNQNRSQKKNKSQNNISSHLNKSYKSCRSDEVQVCDYLRVHMEQRELHRSICPQQSFGFILCKCRPQHCTPCVCTYENSGMCSSELLCKH